MDLTAYLLNELRTRDWSMADLARRARVSKQVVSGWLAVDEANRVVPGPASCRKIASALGTDPDYVLALAGHREEADPKQAALKAQEQAAHAELDAWIAILGEDRLPLLMRGLRSTGETIQAIAGMVASVRTADNAPTHTADNRGRRGRPEPIIRRPDGSEPPISTGYAPVTRALAVAGARRSARCAGTRGPRRA